jgi:hypothetical protein
MTQQAISLNSHPSPRFPYATYRVVVLSTPGPPQPSLSFRARLTATTADVPSRRTAGLWSFTTRNRSLPPAPSAPHRRTQSYFTTTTRWSRLTRRTVLVHFRANTNRSACTAHSTAPWDSEASVFSAGEAISRPFCFLDRDARLTRPTSLSPRQLHRRWRGLRPPNRCCLGRLR